MNTMCVCVSFMSTGQHLQNGGHSAEIWLAVLLNSTYHLVGVHVLTTWLEYSPLGWSTHHLIRSCENHLVGLVRTYCS